MTSSLFTFRYLPIPKRDPKTKEIIGEVYYPVIPTRISYGYSLGRVFHALLDSGAGKNLFPAELGELLGMKIKKGKTTSILGIGDIEIKGFTHRIKIFVGTASFETEADFSYEQRVPLLGRNGFFNHFERVIFREDARTIELIRHGVNS